VLDLTRRAATRRGEIAWERLGDGPPVVLVHGTPSRALVWRQVAAALSREHTVHVFDLLGFGDSERHVEQDVSLVAHGEVLAELIEHWGLDEPALVGHDIGGAVVLRAHLLEGAPASRLALVDAVVLRPWITERTRAMQAELESWGDRPDELVETIEEHLRSATSTTLDGELFDALFGQWSGERGRSLYLRNVGQLDEDHTTPLEDALESIGVPTLVLWGEDDAWLDVAVSERIAARIPRARRVVIPGAGHFSMEDAPDRVSSELSAFLRPR
jgi:pimeloyl-ACP methyl ester carboxylesterase